MASRLAARARGCCSLPIPLHSKWGEHGIKQWCEGTPHPHPHPHPHPNPLPASGERERQVARAQFNSIAATAALTKFIHTIKVMAAMRGGHPGQTENCLRRQARPWIANIFPEAEGPLCRHCVPGHFNPAFDFFNVGRAAFAKHTLAFGCRDELQHIRRKRDRVGLGDGLRRAITGTD
jgi:hypothetical protein